METVAPPDLDRSLTYDGRVTRPMSRTRLRVWFDQQVAVVSEVDDNPGMSVTNTAEALARTVELLLTVDFVNGPWRLVEHYPRTPVSFSLVGFRSRTRDQRSGDTTLVGAWWKPIPPDLAWVRSALDERTNTW